MTDLLKDGEEDATATAWADPAAAPLGRRSERAGSKRRSGSDTGASMTKRVSDDRSVQKKVSSEPAMPTFSSIVPSGDVEAQQTLWYELSRKGHKMQWPIVQFSAFIYYCMENEPFMSMEVMRIGNLKERSSVPFRTRDASAKAGIHYIPTQGVLTFEPGVNTAVIQVPLEASERWDTTLEFVVELGHTELVNAIPGRYLWQARVKVMQVRGDTFPTDKFSIEIMKRRFHKVPNNRLFLEYCKMNLRQPQVKKGTLIMLFIGMVRNAYRLLQIAMLFFGCALVVEPSAAGDLGFAVENREQALWHIAIAIFAPVPFIQLLSYRIPWLQVDSTSRSLLQRNLLRRFLNFTDQSRQELREGDLLLTITRDVEALVSNGFMNLPHLLRSVGEMLLLLLFQFAFPAALGDEVRLEAGLPLLLFPVVLLALLTCCHRRTSCFLEFQGFKYSELCQHVGDTTRNFPLIADYSQRPYFVEIHEGRINDYNLAAAASQRVINFQALFVPLVMNVLLLVRIPLGGKQVLEGQLHVSYFATDLAVLLCMGRAAADVQAVVVDIQRCFTALLRLVTLLNLRIDLAQRMQVNRGRRDETKAMRKKAFEGEDTPQVCPIDRIPITVTNLDFSLLKWCNQQRNEENLVAPLKFEGSLEISQGQFVVLVGPHGEGKSTLLRLIGDMIVQETVTNIVFVPSHLRVLHVCCEPLFFHGSLYANLTFGVRAGDFDGRMDRVLRICARLGLGEQVLQVIETGDIYQWSTVLSETQRALINLARALIANPEVMCIHKPTEVFDKQTTSNVLSLLKEFVQCKGIQQDPATWHLRRPRTCIITSAKKRSMQLADTILHVSSARGVVKVDFDECGEIEVI